VRIIEGTLHSASVGNTFLPAALVSAALRSHNLCQDEVATRRLFRRLRCFGPNGAPKASWTDGTFEIWVSCPLLCSCRAAGELRGVLCVPLPRKFPQGKGRRGATSYPLITLSTMPCPLQASEITSKYHKTCGEDASVLKCDLSVEVRCFLLPRRVSVACTICLPFRRVATRRPLPPMTVMKDHPLIIKLSTPRFPSWYVAGC
jgi:hypothetical protein